MAKKRRAHDEEAWTNAKKICRLTARQVEMARALGMNPRKLPGLRPHIPEGRVSSWQFGFVKLGSVNDLLGAGNPGLNLDS